MKAAFSLVGFLIFFAANSQPKVEVAGAISNIMHKGDLSAYINLDTMQKKIFML